MSDTDTPPDYRPLTAPQLFARYTPAGDETCFYCGGRRGDGMGRREWEQEYYGDAINRIEVQR